MEWVLIIILAHGSSGGPIVIDGFKDPKACEQTKESFVAQLSGLPDVLVRRDMAGCYPITSKGEKIKPAPVPDNPGGPFAD